MRALKAVLREPLLHFALGAAALFGLHQWWSGADGAVGGREIVVDRQVLLQFMQYRAGAFEPGTFAARFDSLSLADREKLVGDYVREEVLYREARALGLEQNDDVMRQRLVQKMRFLLEQVPVAEPAEAALQQFFDAHRPEYLVAPSWTFTHVFVDPSIHGGQRVQRVARGMLNLLNRERVQFNDAPQYSDRFPFLQNYIERTAADVTGHFGAGFMTDLAKLTPGSGRWEGPVQSEQGWHLLLITAQTPERMPTLQELRTQIADDYRREQSALLQEAGIARLVAGYQVTTRDLSEGGHKP